MEKPTNKKIFVVHGHDEELLQEVKAFLGTAGWQPVVLSDVAHQGRTIIEKFESNADVSCAVVLYTACDLGKPKKGKTLTPRARQNVILEFGYFLGKLGRENVIWILDTRAEQPSDIKGLGFVDVKKWHTDLLKELNNLKPVTKPAISSPSPSFPKLPLDVEREEKLEAYRADLIPLVKAVSDRESADLASLRQDTGFNDKVIKFLVSVAAELELIKKDYDSDYCCSITNKGEEFLVRSKATKLPSSTQEQEA